MILEVIVQTVDDARAAEDGGADRLEVVRDIGVGGLTPAIALVAAIQEATRLPLRVMVRENDGFTIGAGELARVCVRCRGAGGARVDGAVMGFAAGRRGADGRPVSGISDGTPRLRSRSIARSTRCANPHGGDLIGWPASPQIDRILTDGKQGSPRTAAPGLPRSGVVSWSAARISSSLPAAA